MRIVLLLTVLLSSAVVHAQPARAEDSDTKAIDYLHVAKVDGRWVIVNVLWERKPKPAAPPAKP